LGAGKLEPRSGCLDPPPFPANDDEAGARHPYTTRGFMRGKHG
jgi:hypothetical protein